MANEEIQFGLGLDTGAFFKGSRAVKAEVATLKEGMSALGTAIKGAFVGLSVAAVYESARGLMEFAKGISEASERAGVSTTFFQQLAFAAKKTGEDAETAATTLDKLAEKIGEASTGSKEAIEVFKKWGVALTDANGKSLDVQTVTENIAKRMNEIESPAQRAAMAVDLMGKSGVKMVEALKGIQEFKEKSKGKILDEGDIARLESAEKTIEGIGGKAKVLGGKLLGAFAVAFGLADPNAELNKAYKRINESADQNDVTPPEVKKTKEYTDALNKLIQARAAASGDKLLNLMEEEARIQDHLKEVAGDEVETIKVQTDLQLKHNEVLTERKRIADEYNKKQEEHLAREKAMQEQVNDAARSAGDAKQNAANARAKGYQLTLEELFQSRLRFTGELGEDQAKAYQIHALEQDANFQRLHGFGGTAKSELSQAEAIRKTLSENVPESERLPFKSLDEAAAKTNEHLEELVRKAHEEGLNVVVQSLPP